MQENPIAFVGCVLFIIAVILFINHRSKKSRAKLGNGSNTGGSVGGIKDDIHKDHQYMQKE